MTSTTATTTNSAVLLLALSLAHTPAPAFPADPVPVRPPPPTTRRSLPDIRRRVRRPASSLSLLSSPPPSPVTTVPSPTSSAIGATRTVLVPSGFSLLQLHVIVQTVFGLEGITAPHKFIASPQTPTNTDTTELLSPRSPRSHLFFASSPSPPNSPSSASLPPPKSPRAAASLRALSTTTTINDGDDSNNIRGKLFTPPSSPHSPHIGGGILHMHLPVPSVLVRGNPTYVRCNHEYDRRRRLNENHDYDDDDDDDDGDDNDDDDQQDRAAVQYAIVEPHPDVCCTQYAPGCYILHSDPRQPALLQDNPWDFSLFENVRDERVHTLSDVFLRNQTDLLYRQQDYAHPGIEVRVTLRQALSVFDNVDPIPVLPACTGGSGWFPDPQHYNSSIIKMIPPPPPRNLLRRRTSLSSATTTTLIVPPSKTSSSRIPVPSFSFSSTTTTPITRINAILAAIHHPPNASTSPCYLCLLTGCIDCIPRPTTAPTTTPTRRLPILPSNITAPVNATELQIGGVGGACCIYCIRASRMRPGHHTHAATAGIDDTAARLLYEAKRDELRRQRAEAVRRRRSSAAAAASNTTLVTSMTVAVVDSHQQGGGGVGGDVRRTRRDESAPRWAFAAAHVVAMDED